jgi:membrane fusion protein, heavy metal efflux system
MKKLHPLLFLATVVALHAGPGHDHGEAAMAHAAPSSGPVRLTEMMVRNLDLQTAEVELRALEKTFPALGHVEADQARVMAVTTRVPGRVTRLAAYEGQQVREGDFLLEVESRIVADPPPKLQFKAPRDGVILDLHTLSGEAVAPESHLLKVADLSEVFAVAQVYEGQLAAVSPGQRVRVRPIAYRDLAFEGEVVRTAASLDRETGTLRVFVRVVNKDGKLLPGMRVQLAFVTADSEAAVVVPRAAVLGEAGDLFVFRQLTDAPFTYERTPVVIGLRDDRFVEIIDGVLPGDLVVTRGNYQLQYVGSAGQKIEDDHGHSHGPGGHQH